MKYQHFQNNISSRYLHYRKKQNGAVIVACMTILLVLTIIGTSSVQDTKIEEKLAQSLRDQMIAREEAENSLETATEEIKKATKIINQFELDKNWADIEVAQINTKAMPSEYSVYLAKAWHSYGQSDYGSTAKKLEAAYYRVIADGQGFKKGKSKLAAVIGVEHNY